MKDYYPYPKYVGLFVCLFVIMLLLTHAPIIIASQIFQPNQCAAFDSSSKTLHIPCLKIGGDYYWIDLNIVSLDNSFSLGLKSFGNSIEDGNCATLNFLSNLLHIPCLRLDIDYYWLDLSLVSVDPIILKLTDFGASIKRPTPIKHITVMTYNILNGAGVDELFPPNKEWAEKHGYPGNRLPQIMEIIKLLDPDILGIQEAHQWDLGDPPVVERVANELGMNFSLGESTNPKSGFAHVVLFTKFHIIESESYSDDFTRAAIRVKLVLPDGQLANVFVAHLDSTSSQIRNREVSFIVKEMRPYLDEIAIIMGDMNFVDGWSKEGDILHSAGWLHPLDTRQWIDQIWTSPVLGSNVNPGPEVPSNMTQGASDHMPVAVDIALPE